MTLVFWQFWNSERSFDIKRASIDKFFELIMAYPSQTNIEDILECCSYCCYRQSHFHKEAGLKRLFRRGTRKNLHLYAVVFAPYDEFISNHLLQIWLIRIYHWAFMPVKWLSDYGGITLFSSQMALYFQLLISLNCQVTLAIPCTAFFHAQ